VCRMLFRVVGVVVRMSSRQTTTETSIISAKMSFLNLWNPAGALVSPLGITSHLKDRSGSGMWFSTRPQPRCAPSGTHAGGQSLYRFVALRGASKRSLIGSGYRSFFKTRLIPRKSQQRRRDLSFFQMKRTGAP